MILDINKQRSPTHQPSQSTSTNLLGIQTKLNMYANANANDAEEQVSSQQGAICALRPTSSS